MEGLFVRLDGTNDVVIKRQEVCWCSIPGLRPMITKHDASKNPDSSDATVFKKSRSFLLRLVLAILKSLAS